MPPRKSKQSSTKAPPKKRVAANGYRLPDPLEPGEILVDMVKKKWRLGKSIGKLLRILCYLIKIFREKI